MATTYNANTYSTELVLTNAGFGINCGFDAAYLRLTNDGPIPIHFSLTSSIASTNDHPLLPGERFDNTIPATAVLGLDTTSSTTSTGNSGMWIRATLIGA